MAEELENVERSSWIYIGFSVSSRPSCGLLCRDPGATILGRATTNLPLNNFCEW